MATSCKALTKRARAEWYKVMHAKDELIKAQKRRNAIKTFGSGGHSKAGRKAQIAVEQAVDKLKAVTVRYGRVERLFKRCA